MADDRNLCPTLIKIAPREAVFSRQRNIAPQLRTA